MHLTTFKLRQARADDRLALEQMFHRCSVETRRRRFLGNSTSIPDPYLTDALRGAARHFAVVAETREALVGLASCVQAEGAAELGILVEDGYQGLGLGRRLLDQLVNHARQTGATRLRATMLGEQSWIVRLLRLYGQFDSRLSFGVLEATVSLAGCCGRG